MNRAALLVLRTRLIDAPGGRTRSPYLTCQDALVLLAALLDEAASQPVMDTGIGWTWTMAPMRPRLCTEWPDADVPVPHAYDAGPHVDGDGCARCGASREHRVHRTGRRA